MDTRLHASQKETQTMATHRKLISLVAVVSMLSAAASCTTMGPVPSCEAVDVADRIKAGDRIQYRTIAGEEGQLTVTATGGGTIRGLSAGEQKAVAIADLVFLEKTKPSILRKTGLTFGSLLFLTLARGGGHGSQTGPGVP